MGGRRRQRPHHQQGALRSGGKQLAAHMTKTSFHPITGDGVPDCLGHDKTHARRVVMAGQGIRGYRRVVHSGCGQLGLNGRTSGPGGMYHHGLSPCPGTTMHHGTELTGPMHAGTGGQHEPSQTGMTQADRLARPLRRRAARMLRPERVRIRERKPWLRARRRLLGWKVRFTGYSPLCIEDHPGETAGTATLCPGRPVGRRGRNRHRRRLSNDTSRTPLSATPAEPVLNHIDVVHSTRRRRPAMMAAATAGAVRAGIL